MSFNRREFLTFLGTCITTTACGGILQSKINEGFLVVNFEYVSPTPCLQSHEMVMKK